MKSQILLALAGAFGASALVPRSEAACSNPKCQTVAQILKQAKQDPLIPLKPDVAQFPCDMGTKIPKGDVPTGCADLEIIAGMEWWMEYYNCQRWLIYSLARGTSEPGNLGVVVADPLVARVKRDLPGVKVRGYPVQVSKCQPYSIKFKPLKNHSIMPTCLELQPVSPMSKVVLQKKTRNVLTRNMFWLATHKVAW